MMLKKTRSRLLVLLLFAFVATLATAEPKISLAAKEHFKPFSWLEDGQVTGIDIDISRELCHRAEVDCDIFLAPWKRIVTLVAAGELDGAIGAFKSPDREGFAYYLDRPLHYTRQYVYVNKDKVFEYNSIEDLYGRVVANNRGFRVSAEFDQAILDKKFFHEESDNNDISLLRLANGRVDAVVGSQLQMLVAIRRLGIQDRIIELPTRIIPPRPSYLILSKEKANDATQEIITRLNASLEEMYADGTVEAMTKKYVDPILEN